MESLLKLFKYLNRRKFLIEICNLNPDAGLNHRLSLKGTNGLDKKTEPLPEEKAAIKAGLISMKEKIDVAINTLD